MEKSFLSGQAYGSGHIHDTFLVAYGREHKPVRYVFQRINDHVFHKPSELMDNILRITTHQQRKLAAAGQNDITRFCLRCVCSKEEKPFFIDEEGKYWRAYLFIENAHTSEAAETPRQAFEAAAAFGRFQKNLLDLPGRRLHEIIPDFHNTLRRFEALQRAVRADPHDRAKYCEKEIAFAEDRRSMTSRLVRWLAEKRLPERITHNDTKLNNVLFDDQTQQAVCVIDLDTVMPGSVLYDFGDLVRSYASSAAEDEKDLQKVFVRTDIFEAVARGYLSEARDFLIDLEKEHLVFSGKVLALELGIRFLTDFLNGDTYFKTAYALHNLMRCRAQCKLLQSMEENEKRLRQIIQSCL